MITRRATTASSPIGGEIVPAIGIDPVHGGGYLTLLAGRPPSAPNEIALGAQTMRAMHRRLGQTVQVAVNLVATPGPVVERTMHIVGVAVLPAFGRGTFVPTDLGTGAAVSASLLSAPFAANRLHQGRVTCYNFFLLRYRPGTDLTAAAARLPARWRPSWDARSAPARDRRSAAR